jgi:cyclic pyranopterin phosphate synthase
VHVAAAALLLLLLAGAATAIGVRARRRRRAAAALPMAGRDVRFVLSTRCNYACTFCHMEMVNDAPDEEALDASDYEFLYRAAATLGARSATLTGGAPTLRRDCAEIARRLHALGARVTLVTNGSTLERTAAPLRQAGVAQVNVSLHSLQPEAYRAVTGGRGRLARVQRGIARLAADGSTRVHLNAVLLESTAVPDIEDLETYASGARCALKMIECFEPGAPRRGHALTERAVAGLLARGTHHAVDGDGTGGARRSRSLARAGTARPAVTFTRISCAAAAASGAPAAHCRATQDLFITPRGDLKPCSLRDGVVPLLPLVRRRDTPGLLAALRTALAHLGDGCPLEAMPPTE